MEAEDCAFYRFINVITHLGKGCKSRARGKRFANFSRVLFTSQMDCYAGKPMESAIYYWCNFSNDMHDQFNDKKKSVKLIMVSWFQCLIEPNSYTMFRKTTVIKTKETNILKDTEYWLGLQLWNLNWTGFWMIHRPCMVFIFTLRILMFFLFFSVCRASQQMEANVLRSWWRWTTFVFLWKWKGLNWIYFPHFCNKTLNCHLTWKWIME